MRSGLLGVMIIIIMVDLTLTSCGGADQSAVATPTSSSTSLTTSSSAMAATASPSPTGVELEPPDADGNPPCGVGIGWDLWTDPNDIRGTMVQIEKTIPANFVNLPDHFTVRVTTNDGQHLTQDDYVTKDATGDWDSVIEKDFIFKAIDPFNIQHVLVTSSKGICWAYGVPI